MFDIYPNVLLVVQGMNVSMDQSGNFVPMPPSELVHCVCKPVRNGSAQLIKLEGGGEYIYKYVIFMPATTPTIKIGTQIKVIDPNDDSVVANGRVEDFVSSPLGCKLFI